MNESFHIPVIELKAKSLLEAEQISNRYWDSSNYQEASILVHFSPAHT